MTTLKVTVLRSRVTGKVLLLEAGKDFVDRLISFLLLPLGSIVHMLSQASPGVSKLSGGEFKRHAWGVDRAPSEAFGGIWSIFESVEKLHSSFLHVDKHHLVQPRPAAAAATCESTALLRLPALEAAFRQWPSPPPKTPKKPVLLGGYYKCNGCFSLWVTQGQTCYVCVNKKKSTLFNRNYCEGPYSAVLQESEDPKAEDRPSSQLQGFVKENGSYMVTDDLEIVPSTTIQTISLLKNLEVASLGDLESNHVSVSITQVLQLLQSALTSTTCLNDVFGNL